MDTFNHFYGVTILKLKLRHSVNVCSTLQTTPCQGKEVADLTLVTLNFLRSDENFDLTWNKVLNAANILQLTATSLRRKRKRATKVLSGKKNSVSHVVYRHSTDVFILMSSTRQLIAQKIDLHQRDIKSQETLKNYF